MSDDSLARSQSAMLSSVDADYDAIHATIVATERGRWFLEQHMLRARGADTQVVLAALKRIEQALGGGPTADQQDDAPIDVQALAELVGRTRADLIAEHGDLAASGEAALADFRNALEQIQELVWDMHGRDTASEFGSQLSLQTNRLTAAGDRLERSVGGLRILLGLLDDLDQKLRELTDAPAAEPVFERPDSSQAAFADPAATTVTAAEPAPSPGAPDAAAAWSIPVTDAETAAPAAPAFEPPVVTNLMPVSELGREPLPQEPAFEPLWQEVPAAFTHVAETPAPAPADPMSEAAVTDWAFVPDDTEPKLDVAASVPPLPSEPVLRTESQLERQEADPARSAIERLQARESERHWETPVDVPQAAAAPPPSLDALIEPQPPSLEELVMGPPPAPGSAHQPFAETGWQAGGYAQAPSHVEWIEVPTASETVFDADMFERDHPTDTDDPAAVDNRTEPRNEAPPVDDLAWLTTDARAEEQAEVEPPVPVAATVEMPSEAADAIPSPLAAVSEPAPVEAPVTEEPAAEVWATAEAPVVEAPVAKPAAEPVAEEPAAEEALAEPVAEPVAKEQATDEAFAESIAEPVAEEQATEEAVAEPVAEPMAEEPAAEETLAESEAEPAAEEPVAEVLVAQQAITEIVEEEPVAAAFEPAAPQPEPADLESLFADPEPALEPKADVPPQLDSEFFDDTVADPDTEQPGAFLFGDDVSEGPINEGQGPSEPEPDLSITQPAERELLGAEPPAPTTTASLYDAPSYTEPAPSVRAYAGRAYSQRTDVELASVTPAGSPYDWPATFPDRAVEPASDRSSGEPRASAAYEALQSQTVVPGAPSEQSPDTSVEEPSRPAEERLQSEPPPRQFAEEGPDVPTVLERLESVRSAIAALMEEVNEKNARSGSLSSRS